MVNGVGVFVEIRLGSFYNWFGGLRLSREDNRHMLQVRDKFLLRRSFIAFVLV